MKNLTAISIFLFLFSTAAQAGYWTVTYVANGKDTDSQGTYNWPIYPTPEAGMEEWIYLGRSESASTKGVVSSGSIRPVFHWQEGTTGEQPPDKIAYLTSVKAIAGPFPPGAPGQDRVADSFEDQEYYDLPMWSMRLDGNHCRGISVPSGATTVYGPVFTVRASALMEPGQQGYAFTTIGCRVSVISLEISGTSTDGKQGALPPFFSGTNCYVQGDAELPLNTGSGQDAPQGFTEAYLYIGGAEVNRWIHTETTPPKNVSLSARFDSTHFPDGSDIPVMLRVKDDHGMVYEITRKTSAYNKAVALANNTYGLGLYWTGFSSDGWAMASATGVATSLQSMNHAALTSNQYSKADIYNSLPAYTVFYMTTHSDSESISDCYGGLDAGEENTVRAFLNWEGGGVTSTIWNKTSVEPSFNFVMLDGCNTAGEAQNTEPSPVWAKAFFGITPTNDLPTIFDRAFLGWRLKMWINKRNLNWTLRLWNNLADGDTINLAALRSSMVLPPTGYYESKLNNQDAVPVVLGDGRMKLHGVYRPGNCIEPPAHRDMRLDWFASASE